LTGHLVLSTLHTNDAPSAVTRLLDLGVPPFLIQATLIGVVAQRLVRKICPHCRETFEMTSGELKDLGLFLNREGPVTLQRGAGCLRCRGTGYLGRAGVFEVLSFSDAIRRIVNDQAGEDQIREQAKREGMVTLRENAVKKLLQGATTYQEVLRVTWEQG
jgi:general secretion pathway protein E